MNWPSSGRSTLTENALRAQNQYVTLRDTNKINEKHMEALTSSAKKTVELLDWLQEHDSEIYFIYSEMGEYNLGIELILSFSLLTFA